MVEGVGSTSTVVTQFVNIPHAVSDGVEITAYWRPIRHLDLSLTYGLDHTAITSTCSLVNGVATGACYEDVVDPLGTAPGNRTVAKPGGVGGPGGQRRRTAPGAGEQDRLQCPVHASNSIRGT